MSGSPSLKELPSGVKAPAAVCCAERGVSLWTKGTCPKCEQVWVRYGT